jgi:hypothetical protein
MRSNLNPDMDVYATGLALPDSQTFDAHASHIHLALGNILALIQADPALKTFLHMPKLLPLAHPYPRTFTTNTFCLQSCRKLVCISKAVN